MNDWWRQQEYYCKCQSNDPWIHVHYKEPPHCCARCSECKQYRPDISESEAARILLGPEMTNREAAEILLGK